MFSDVELLLISWLSQSVRYAGGLAVQSDIRTIIQYLKQIIPTTKTLVAIRIAE